MDNDKVAFDIFEREQEILDRMSKIGSDIRDGAPLSCEDFHTLVKEYGRLLKQIRRITKLSDRATESLNTSKLDLYDKAHYDVLTGIFNRRYLDDVLSRTIKSLSRSGGVLSVLMLDVDFFKKFNDSYGHSAGDDCLKAIGATLSSCLTRGDDFVARYGGEEFSIVLPNTDKKGAIVIANRILCAIQNQKVSNMPDDAPRVTISIGITSSVVSYSDKMENFIKRADMALYISKQNGRNQYTYLDLREDI